MSRHMQAPSLWQRCHLDTPLLLGLLLVLMTGLIILASAAANAHTQNVGMIERQGIHFLVGMIFLIVIAQIPPRYFYLIAPWLYLIGLLLLLGVLFFGEISKGAQRWLNIGGFRFQPSELMKVAVPLVLAWYFSNKCLPPKMLQLCAAALLILLPAALIAKQPDLDTALLVICAGSFILFLAGMSWRFMVFVGGLGLAFLPLGWLMLHDYQKQRIFTFLNPENDPLGTGYHIIQSKIAIGSGGLYGKGWMDGTQSHLQFLPERWTDFIFAVLGEEFGLLGTIVLLLLYCFILIRALFISMQAQDTFTRLLAGSLTLTFFVYLFVNVGMVTGLLPVVGIPLPLISYGGTSMVTLMAGFGMLMSIQTHRKLLAT